MVAYYGPQHNLDILNRRSSDIENTSLISSKEAPAAEDLDERQAAIDFVEETSKPHEDKDFSGNGLKEGVIRLKPMPGWSGSACGHDKIIPCCEGGFNCLTDGLDFLLSNAPSKN